MTFSSQTRAERATTFRLFAALCFAFSGSMAPSAFAFGSFSAAGPLDKQVFCGIAAVKGVFSGTESRYSASGDCSQLQAPPSTNNKVTSEFVGAKGSTEIFHAAWTAQGTYNPVTKETWEKVTMPAPTIDQKTPVGRPYGNYETRMICATDPWLTGIGVNCTGKTVSATGNLGDIEPLLRQINRPVTTPNKAPQLQALVAAHDRYEKTHSFASTTETNAKGHALAQMFAPTIVEPKAGSTHPPQTPLRIRVAAAANAKDTAYELEIQVQANFDWRAMTTIPINAAVAQSALGYKGWGGHAAGTAPQMMATVGIYRVRARATAPKRSESDWVEFKIDGKPGVSIEDAARSTGEKVGSTPQALKTMKSGTTAGTTEAPRAANATLLKTQPSPFAAARNKTDAVLLNPQPLPPSALPAQAPSALR